MQLELSQSHRTFWTSRRDFNPDCAFGIKTGTDKWDYSRFEIGKPLPLVGFWTALLSARRPGRVWVSVTIFHRVYRLMVVDGADRFAPVTWTQLFRRAFV